MTSSSRPVGSLVLLGIMLSSCGSTSHRAESVSGASSLPARTLATDQPPARLHTQVPSRAPVANVPRRHRSQPCQTGQLKITIGRSAGVAGSESVMFFIRDIAQTPCTLSGFFSIRLLDARGDALRTHVLRDTHLTGPPRPVQITGSKRAEFIYQWGANQTSAAPCPTATKVELIAPGRRDDVRLAARTANGRPIAPCGNGSTAISAVTHA